MKKASESILMKSSGSEKLFHGVNLVILTLFCLLCAYPIWFFIVNSLSSPAMISRGIYLWPREWTIQNYIHLFEKVDNILPAFRISALRSVLGTLATVLCCSFVAFLVTQKLMPCRKLYYRFIVISMYVNAGVIPWFITMKSYGLSNNFLLYVIPSAISAFYVILTKTYIESIPAEMMESAEVDGAGIMTTFVRIVLPLSSAVLASVAVFSAVYQWNQWYDNFMLVNKGDLQTVQYMLYKYLTQNTQMTGNTAASSAAASSANPTSIRITITMVTMIPIIIVYPLMQRYFVKGIMLGAVKG